MRVARKNEAAPYDLAWLMKWVSPEPNSGCWLWTGSVNKGGYGAVGHHGKTRGAHRVSFEIARGPIPAGADLDHLCRVRSCVNPAHLDPVSRSVNLKRGLSGDNLAASARGKTHCPQGHPYSGDNLFTDKRGHRDCVTCRLERTREWRRLRKITCEGASA